MTRYPALESPEMKLHDTVGHALARGLKRHGVSHIFGQSLPSLLFLAGLNEGITQIAYRQENAGGYMADAYARLTGKPGIVTAQNGPAATLLVPPLAECLKSAVPVIALVQDVNRAETDRNAFQEYDQVALFTPCAKWVRKVTDAARLQDYIDMAFIAACSGVPGPAVLLLPFDFLLSKEAVKETRVASLGHYPLDRPTADYEKVEEAAALIAGAARPVVFAGGRIRAANAAHELAALQDEFSLPIFTTVMGKGAVDERHPLSGGVLTNFTGPNGMARYMKTMAQEADLVILIGTRVSQNGTESWTLYPEKAKYIHIDVEPMDVGRNYESLRLVGDIERTIKALRLALVKQDTSLRLSNRPGLEKFMAEAKAKHLQESQAVRLSAATPIRPERVMEELNKRLNAHSIVVTDASYSSIWAANYLTCLKAGMRFVIPRGISGLGWGFPMAIGARVAFPEAPVYCIVGDGGFAHVWGELETVMRAHIKVVLIVLNNGILGYQKHAENWRYGAHTNAVNFQEVDHAGIARCCGLNGIRVSDPAQLAEALQQADKADKTTLIEVICDEKAYPPLSFLNPVED